MVDTAGLLMHAVVHPADIQDRDGGILVMTTLFGLYPFLRKLFADAGYQGPKFRDALAKAKLFPQLCALQACVVARIPKTTRPASAVSDATEVLVRTVAVPQCSSAVNVDAVPVCR